MTNRIALITDSTCDIPQDWLEKYDLKIVPLSIIWGDDQYLDGVDISAEEFYDRLPNDPHHPTTSQPAPKSFLEAFQEAQTKGYDEVLVITISSAMSGTIESARRASEESPIPVTIVDGKNNSMGLGWQVIAAARARENGGGIQEMVDAAYTVQKKIQYYISLDTMKYLDKGGRIGDAVKFLSSVLNIKPMIYVKNDTGTVGAALPSRSRASAVKGLIKTFFSRVDPSRPLHITVLHNAALDEAEQLAAFIKETYKPIELFISIVSPVLGVHTGPKALAICGYND